MPAAKMSLLRLAAALEQKSEHPIATGIMQKAKELGLVIPAAENFMAITGKGVEAMVEGKKVAVVSPGYLAEKNLPLPEGFTANDSETIVFVLVDQNLKGYIALSDEIRPIVCGDQYPQREQYQIDPVNW